MLGATGRAEWRCDHPADVEPVMPVGTAKLLAALIARGRADDAVPVAAGLVIALHQCPTVA